MNNLTVKEVNFQGMELLAIQQLEQERYMQELTIFLED